MKRVVETELLDGLPHDNPEAMGSRRDLRRLNRAMGHVGIFENLLHPGQAVQMPKRIVEIGAGDGTLMLNFAKQLSPWWKNVEVVLVDRNETPTSETRAAFEKLGWSVEPVLADVFDWLQSENENTDIMMANLFLHHFQPEELKRMMGLAAQRTKVFAACEPRRSTMPLVFSRMVGFIGCNAVTRHDAVLSVRAGFAGQELSQSWPQKNGWRLSEHSAGLFTHTFLAERNVTNGAH